MAKTVLITGSSSGIGKTTALYFQEQGWNVVATMRSPEKAADLAELDNVLVTRLDVTDTASIATAVQAGLDKFGSIDALVNNAGYGAFGALEAFPMDKIRRQFETNVIGLLAVTQAVIPVFRAQQSGVIVNISSVGGRIAFPLFSLYHGTKFAVEGLTESLHYELDPLGIQVKLVEPGAIATDFAGRSLDLVNDDSISAYQDIAQKLIEAFAAIGEHASPPSLVAETIWQAATDGSNTLRYVVGEDAKAFIANRNALDDEAFMGGIKQQFGL